MIGWFEALSAVFIALAPQKDTTVVEVRGARFTVEVVRTPKEWRRGLMFREKLGRREGMLFWGSREELQSFWMKNTLVPLDIIYIGKDLRIVHIVHRAEPLSETPLPSLKPALHILEILGGEAASLGIKAGDLVRIFKR